MDSEERGETGKLFRLPGKSLLTSKEFISSLLVLASLLGIMYLAFYVRSGTLDLPTVLDYDPWWFFRHASEIVENNMAIPSWDELSHFPPGRPYEAFQGWSYTIAIFYQILNSIIGFTLTETAKWSTIIMAAAAVVPAYLLGRKFSNKLGGVCTALFAVLTPALISVSMAGYSDSDMVVAFYTLLSVYAMVLAMEKKPSLKALPYYIFAVLVNLAFVFTWGFGWIIQIFFSGFIVAVIIFRAVEQIIHNRKLRLDTSELFKEKWMIVSLVAIILATNIAGTLMGMSNIFETSGLGLQVTEGTGLIVNISVAELQNVNILSAEGLQSIVERVGLAPTIFTIFLPFLFLYKLYKKEKISSSEVFLLIWIMTTFFLINFGVRFSILFSTASAVAAGYLIGKTPAYLDRRLLKSTFFAFTSVLLIIFVSNSLLTGYSMTDMGISENWYSALDWIKTETDPEALIVTWWDPGHIIAGYTDHRVMGDGAHCGQGVGACLPYGHDIRIQDMGRVFSISDEDEAVSILEKYKGLSDEQCSELQSIYGDQFPVEMCEPVPEMYIVASSDLIQKYYWLSYFGNGGKDGRSYWQMQLTDYDQEQNVLEYANGQVSLVYNNGTFFPVMNMPEYRIRNSIVSQIVYFENGEVKHYEFDEEDMIDGLVWANQGFGNIFFMDALTRDSIFNRMFFFDGEGLEHFELVYSNPEIRVFKVLW